MAVKDIIKNRRIELGLTMKEVADAVGVSEGTISRWESGHIANMRRDKIVALAKVLGLSPSVIMEWDGNKMISISAVAEAAGIDDGTHDFIDKMASKERNAKISESINARQQAVQKNEHPMYYTDPVTARMAQKYFEDENFRVLFDAAEDSSPENIKLAAEMLRRMKEK